MHTLPRARSRDQPQPPPRPTSTRTRRLHRLKARNYSSRGWSRGSREGAEEEPYPEDEGRPGHDGEGRQGRERKPQDAVARQPDERLCRRYEDRPAGQPARVVVVVLAADHRPGRIARLRRLARIGLELVQPWLEQRSRTAFRVP